MANATEQRQAPQPGEWEELNSRLLEECAKRDKSTAAIEEIRSKQHALEKRVLLHKEEVDIEAQESRELTAEQQGELLAALENRLGQDADCYKRPEGIIFGEVKKALEANPAAMWSLFKMEETGGEPDIVAIEDNAFVFADCSAESPAGRRDCVYDKAAEASASGTFNSNAVDMAKGFGVDIWSPDFYREMQKLGKFDRQTWSWVKTDDETRQTGFARCGPRVGDHLFVNQANAGYHSEFGGWRGVLRVQKA